MYGVDHAGVVTCHEVFYSRGSFQMVLEYMDGGSLLDAMRRARDSPARGGGGLTPGALAVIGRSVASALEMLHEVLEVVHRDVKPGNILLTSQGTVKLADLGICTPPGSVQDAVEASSGSEGGCETPATEWIGTVTYMSPERRHVEPGGGAGGGSGRAVSAERGGGVAGVLGPAGPGGERAVRVSVC
eukprot:3933375-Rhodomonas_salina.1